MALKQVIDGELREMTAEEEAEFIASRPESVPQSVTPRQAKLALHAAGHPAAVEAAIASSDLPTQISWNNALEFRRDDPLVNSLGGQLGLTSEQVDGLFRAAASL